MNNNLIIGAVVALILIGGVIFAMSMSTGTNKVANTTPTESVEQMEQVDNNVAPTMEEQKEEAQTIVDVAVKSGNFTTLVTAVKAANLVETLSSEGPYTVFAPTDEAFAKLPKETLDSLLKDPQKLASILTYHVVSGKVMASEVVNLTEAKTVNGQTVSVKVMDGKVLINDANVITTDIDASNGVIHVIDTVLLPK